MRSSRAVFLVTIVAGTGFAAESVLPDCIPPGTKVVFGVSVRSLLDSPVLKSFQSDMQKASADLMKGGPLPILEMIKSGPLPGFDPLKDVDELIIASTADKDKATALIVLRGRFDPKSLPGTSSSYNGVLIFGDGQKANGTLALLDESTAIVGDFADVRAAIDRRGTPSHVNRALAAKAGSMAGRFDFWGVGDLPEGFRPPGGADDSFNSIDHFEFGASLRHGLEITGEVHARSTKDAGKMAEAMKMIEDMLKNQPQRSANGTKFDLQSSNGTIKLSIAVSEEDLKKGIEAQKSSLSAAVNSRIGAASGLSADAPKPPAKPRPHPQIVKDTRGDTVNVILPGGH
jgi:hypothetical protein